MRQKLERLALPAACVNMPGVFWRPNPDFIAELATFLKGKRVLEIFAGNGYMAGWLSAEGIEVTATTQFAGHDLHYLGLYHEVEDIDACRAVQKYGNSHDVLLICWPTTTPAAVRAAELWGPAKDIVFVGEVTDYSKMALGGCATDEFFDSVTFGHVFRTYQGNYMEQARVGRFKAS